jgi:hypothetical protein
MVSKEESASPPRKNGCVSYVGHNIDFLSSIVIYFILVSSSVRQALEVRANKDSSIVEPPPVSLKRHILLLL